MKIFKIIAIILSSFLLFSCSEKKKNKYVMATSADYPPFEFHVNGKIQGFDIDIAELFAAHMKKEIEIKDMDFASIIPSIGNHQVDFALSAISASSDRVEFVDFSDGYYKGASALLIAKNSNIDSFPSLKGKKLGVQLGSVWEQLAKEHKTKNNIEIYSANKVVQLVEELKLGRISAVLIDEEQALEFTKRNESLTFVILDSEVTPYVALFPKNSDLIFEFNKFLQEIKQNGELQKLKQKWLMDK